MGATHVTVTIRNTAAPHRSWEGLFLVDTGATDCLVPRQHRDKGYEPAIICTPEELLEDEP